MDKMVLGYLETAHFADCPESSKHYLGGGNHYRKGDIGTAAFCKRAIAGAELACKTFLDMLSLEARELADSWEGGSDLWYTRNGHGVGFWEDDRGWGEHSRELADMARRMGEVYVVAGRYLDIQ